MHRFFVEAHHVDVSFATIATTLEAKDEEDAKAKFLANVPPGQDPKKMVFDKINRL